MIKKQIASPVLEETNDFESTWSCDLSISQSTSTFSEFYKSQENYGHFAKRVGLISPDLGFYVNREALDDNVFINTDSLSISEEESTFQAQLAFDRYVETLKANKIDLEVFHQSTKAADSIFPDWFTTVRNQILPDGVLIISSMKNLERRKERMEDTIWDLSQRYGNIVDLSFFEAQDRFLELKGALVTDWENGKIYCNISERAHEKVFDYLIDVLNNIASKTSQKRIKGVKFRAFDKNGMKIYHTDCMMTLLNKHAVVCLDSILDKSERETVIRELTDADLNVRPKEIITISYQESENMCANMFNILDRNNDDCVIMSRRANSNFTKTNLDILYKDYKIIVADIDIIEQIGGGSARWMLVELF